MKLLSILVAAAAVVAMMPSASAGDRWSLSDRHSPSRSGGDHGRGFTPAPGGGWVPSGHDGSGSPTPVPEPASMAILGSGLAALVAARLRQRRRK